ncbi:RidA family protein [Hydrogenophaga borbori]|uniref:RidA family protein n=1 Tax=Hydrogenophaga borbori TaxID=2294117 RepID=UPI00301CEDEF
MNRFQSPEGLARPNGFSHTARTTGRTTVFVSGQVSYDASGRVVGEGDLAAQTRQVYRNLQAALQAEGASMHDVVKTVLFVRDLDPDKARAIREARSPFLNPEGLPASTMVGVASLARPELLLEVEAIAVLD